MRCARPIEELPLLDHVRSRRRRRDRGRVLRVRLGITHRHVGLLERLQREREARHLERELRRDHVVREPRRRRELHVERHEQVERLHRAARLVLIGPGRDRVAADADQRADPAVAGLEDLVGERGGRQARGAVREAAHAQLLAESERAPRRLRLRHGHRLRQAAHPGSPRARPRGASARRRVETQQQVLGEIAARRHVRARARDAAAAPRAAEHARRALDLLGRARPRARPRSAA